MAIWSVQNVVCRECGALPGYLCNGPIYWNPHATVHKDRFKDACRLWEVREAEAFHAERMTALAAQEDAERLLSDPKVRGLLCLALRGTEEEAALALKRARDRVARQ
jgi:hypothetical protein